MKTKLDSIIIIAMIAISLVSFAHADSILTVPNYHNADYDYTGHANYQVQHTTSKHMTVSLTESIKFKTDGNFGQGLQNDQTQDISTSKKTVSFSDDLTLRIVHVAKITTIITVIPTENSQSITSIEKLANVDRIRFTGRSIVVDSVPSTTQDTPSKLFREMSVDTILYNKQANDLEKELQNLLSQSTGMIILGTNHDLLVINSISNNLGNSISSFGNIISSQNNPTLLVVLLPLSGYILIRSENDRIKIKNTRQFFCLFFIVLLMSSTAITPLSISHSYWGMAFADGTEPNNDTISSNSTVPTNSTTPINYAILNNDTASISLTPIQNQSDIINPQNIIISSSQSNTTVSDPLVLEDVIEASLSNMTNSSNSQVNETNSSRNDMSSSLGISDTVEATANTLPDHNVVSLGIADTVNATTNHTVSNNTGVSGIITQPELPNATKSFNFTSLDGKVGKAVQANGTLELLGTGYITQKVNNTNSVKNFTISALVQPDYTQGSSVFTVISKDNQFALTINNMISPHGIAQFSVFDGIKWNTVNSTGIIQNWTHLAATYNGTDIAIYVNGTQQNSLRLPGVLTITDDGHLTPVTPDHLASNSDVVIGATIDTIRDYAKDRFSGQIKDVNFYSTLLDQSQIQQLYVLDTQGVQSGPISASVPMAESVSISDSILALVNSTSGITNGTGINATSINGTGINGTGINGTGINGTGINGTGINGTGINATALSVVPTITNLKSSYTIGENPEFEFKIFKDSDINKIKKTVKASMQQNGWNEKNTTISVTVTAPDGTIIPLKSQFKKMKEGQFDIKILSKKYGKPGMYTITTTMIRDGKTYTTQDQYAWGLVSLNTQKSIYSPGDTANMTVVVLDSGGHPVCDANLSVLVTDPSSHITTLVSGVGVSAGSECGLYNAQYATTVPGNYTVNVSATADSIQTNFNTSFLAQNNIPFDIIRTAQSKIDPVNNPNMFNVKIDVSSFVNQTGVTIKESVPSVLNITTDASVQTIGDSKILTWNKNMIGTKTSVQYSYAVPLVFPQLYALGPVQITYGNQTFTEARQWFVANDPLSVAKLYLHAATSSNAPTDGEKSTALPVGTLAANSGTGFEDLSMSSFIGTSTSTVTISGLAQTARQDNYIARFTSSQLAAQTIPSGTWTFALQTSEANTAANSFLAASLYVWRPSTSSVVGYIYDNSTGVGTEWGASKTGKVVTVSGGSVAAADGDVLVFEVWRTGSQGSATARVQTIFFDGTTDVTDGATAAAASASYVQSPANLIFKNTRLYLHAATSSNAPTDGEKSTALPVGTFQGNSGTGFEDLSMSPHIGTSQTTKTISGLAQTARQDNYIARFTSSQLAAQTIPSGTWTFALQTSEANTAANSFLVASLYVWRPSTSSVVGYIYDNNTGVGTEWGTTTTGKVVTVSGGSVAAADGDVLVFEVWRTGSQGSATARVQTIFFDGTTDVTENGNAPSAARLY